MRYSALNDGVTLKSRFRVVQGRNIFDPMGDAHEGATAPNFTLLESSVRTDLKS